MSCPSCGQTEPTVTCVDCSAPTVNCPNPNPCVDVISTDCVIYTGVTTGCHLNEPLLINNVSMSTNLKNIVDYFCEHTHVEQDKIAGGVPILTIGDGMTESLINVIDYFSNLISNLGGGTGGSGGLVTKTHAEMVVMVGAGTLSPGQWYLISDFATMYEQPDFTGTALSNIVPVATPVVKTSAVEPIYVQAVSTTKLNPYAYQSQYAKDIIKYELAYTTPVTNTATKGRITLRMDEFGNTTSYDHRTVLFKRYKDVNGIFSSVFDLTYGDFEYLTFDGQLTPGTKVYNNFIPNHVVNYVFDLPNVVFRANAYDNVFGSEFSNNTFLGSCFSNKLTVAKTNIAFSTVSNNTFAAMQQNIIKKAIEFNNVAVLIANNVIDAAFVNNTLSTVINNIITASSFSNNVIDTLNGNTISSTFQFANNAIQVLNSNLISNLFQNNLFSLSVSNCNFNYAAENNSGVSLQYVNTSNSVVKKLQYNNFDYPVIGTVGTPIDLAAATHVYGDYTCKIFKNQIGDLKVSYYNSLDSEVTTLITL
jgi:hypothetical protein